MKKCVLVFLIVLFSQGVSHSIADRDIYLQPESGMPNREQIVENVKEFFSVRCGVPYSEFNSISFDEVYYGTLGYGIIENGGNMPVWEVTFSMPQCGRYFHVAYLDKEGNVLYWASHGTEHWIDEPDILATAVLASHLGNDADEEAIIASVKEKLIEKGSSLEEISSYSYSAHFIYEKHLDDGHTPYWLTDVYGQDVLLYRALYAYNGTYVSLITPAEDFSSYTSPDPLFGDVYPDIREKCHDFPSYSVSKKNQVAAEIRPFVQAWMVEYPYYINNPGDEYYISIVNHYSLPDKQAISENEAVKIAKGLKENFSIDNKYMNKRSVISCYLLDDEDKPFWRITIGPAKVSNDLYRENPNLWNQYVVKIDAYSGDVLDLYSVTYDTSDSLWKY